MLFIRIGHATTLLLFLAQSSVLASGEREKNGTETEASFEIIANYFRLPWIDGIEWITKSTESPDNEKVRAVIRGIEHREPWAMQILDALSEDDQKNIQRLRCTRSKGQNGHCVESYDAENDDIAKDAARNKPVKSKAFTTEEMFAIFLFSSIVVILIGCTLCDVARRKSPRDTSTTVETLAKFSLYTNTIDLLKTTQTSHTMPAIHGIRFLCCMMIITSHRILCLAIGRQNDLTLLDIINAKETWSSVFVGMTGFAVESFGVISGFFMANTYFRLKQSGTKFNLPMMYLYRYLRITPCLASLVLFIAVLVHRFGYGPSWESMAPHLVDPCRENWWNNLLYIHNFSSEGPLCLPHTWYLALDMQIFWLSPIILYPLYRWPKFGMKLLGSFLLLSAVTPAIVLAFKGYSNVWLRLDRDLLWHVRNSFSNYIPTYNRACAHLIGILLGYDMATRKRNLSKETVAINWIATVSVPLFCLWSINHAYNSTFAYNLGLEIIWALLLRPAWSIATAWVIYACTHGYGGLATKFLSSPIFFPLSRLSLCIYLVHPVIQLYQIISPEFTAVLSGYDMLIGVIIDLLLSIPVAFVLNLLIETPVIILTKILLTNLGRQPKSTTMAKEPEKIS